MLLGAHAIARAEPPAIRRKRAHANDELRAGAARPSELRLDEAALSAQIPARRLGRPKDFAAAAAFLCSDQANYITGQAIACDGGLLQSI